MKSVTWYICEVCGSEYLAKAFAYRCERFKLAACPAKPGDRVRVYERHEPPKLDRVVSARRVPGLGPRAPNAWVAQHGADDGARTFLLRQPMPIWHKWLVTVEGHHVSKDGGMVNEVSLDLLWKPDEDVNIGAAFRAKSA